MNTKYIVRGIAITVSSAGVVVLGALSAWAGRYNGRY